MGAGTTTTQAAVSRIPPKCTHAFAPRLCAIHHHRGRTNKMRRAMGQARIPYGWMAERHPARRDAALAYWVGVHLRTQHRYRAWLRAPWRHDPFYRDAMCVHDGEGGWHENTGNGYYGGMQFDIGTWISNGGSRYAARADLATVEEQLIITYHTVRSRGWGPWPNTAAACGLL